MSIEKFKGKVSNTVVLNNKFIVVHVELLEPNRLEFAAGQYLLLDVEGTEQKKSYSICSAPSLNHAVELLVDVTPGGHGSKHVQALEPGHEVSFMAPVGVFTLGAEDLGEEKLVFVATGSGVSPLRSMILDLLIDKKDKRPISLFWGLRGADDMIWEEDFQQLADEYENFEFELILSQPPEGWKLSRGYVTDLLGVYDHGGGKTGYYVCGNTGMIEDAKALLAKEGVPDAHVHNEKFY